jgi:hypothetical protein
MKLTSISHKFPFVIILVILLTMITHVTNGQKLQISDSGYLEKPGVNILVFSSQYKGMFYGS